MKCPHCLESFHAQWKESAKCETNTYYWYFAYATCPACLNDIIQIQTSTRKPSLPAISLMAYPKGVARVPLSPAVPPECSSDYREACLVLPDSAKASAALSRRCLQHLLLKTANTKETKELAKQIDEVLPSMPPYIRPTLDAVRNIGNIAAHPMESQSTGEIVDVEPHEAELLLEILEQLFDYYFVKPAETKKRLDAINVKLKDAGKPPLKS